MLLFDDGKRLEKAIGEEAAQIIISMLERMNDEQSKEAATKGDLREAELRLLKEIETVRKETREVELHLVEKIESTKHELLKWFIGMAVAQTGVLAALYAIMK